jgi:hypothetical protein
MVLNQHEVSYNLQCHNKFMHAGVYFELNGIIYPNNSAVPLSLIGTDTSALHCHTNKEGCCGTPGMMYGEFYYPNGTAVPIDRENYGMYRIIHD